jgi:hypothetical protein
MGDVLTGGCNCGAVRYEVDELVGATYCHCHRCQRRSGAAASPSAHAAPGAFRIVAGGDALGVWAPEGGSEKWFCAQCGSALFAKPAEGEAAIRLGTFDADPGVRPTAHVWCESAAPWEPLPDDGLPRFAQGRGSAPFVA